MTKKKQTGNNGDKIPVNFYLTSEVLEDIDDCIFYIKKCLPMEKRRKLNRSVFYEIVLKTVIKDYDEMGKESALWKEICEIVCN